MKKNTTCIIISVLICACFFFTQNSFAQTANDPLIQQWSYTDTGVFDAWKKTTGSKHVVVAIIDNGFDQHHTELRDNVWRNRAEIPHNKKDDDNNGYIDDVWGWNFIPEDTNNDGVIDEEEKKGNNNPVPPVNTLTDKQRKDGVIHHGTLIAGIIGATGNNNRLGAGINWQVQLMNLRIIDNSGFGGIELLPSAIYYAVDNGADIINLSIVSQAYDQAVADAIDYAYNNNVAVVAAAGNSNVFLNTNPFYPICSDNTVDVQKVLGVSAISEDHLSALFSNFGSNCVDLTAPGVGITSTVRHAPSVGLDKEYTGPWNGTSFATPFVSGALALVKSLQPIWRVHELYDAILLSTHKTPPKDDELYRNLYGKGLLQINKAVAYAADRITSTKLLSHVYYFSQKRGIVYKNTIGEVGNRRILVPFLKSADVISGTKVADSLSFIAAKYNSSEQSAAIKIYNNKWNTMEEWSIPAQGPVDAIIADVYNNPGTEVIISPKYPSKTLFWVYTENGELLKEHTMPMPHDGALLSIGYNRKTVQKEIVVAYTQNNNTVFVNRFNNALAIVDSFSVSSLTNMSHFGVGDLDGDTQDEYIFTDNTTSGLWMFYIEKGGNLKRKFSTYSIGYNELTSFVVGDYDHDGKDDCIIAPVSDTKPMTAWSGKARKIASEILEDGEQVQLISVH
ncbi:MAG: hypothetical protein CL685_03405 [Candidatus Magasanikbacteria bacterium]|nr:hypothetical protein [Candidatus Magasanikbacteria bacterium]|tara:strand:+ start:219 stop:2249 length:2031 start_codon:yes stop_codon:yes gene_type:complete